MSDTIEVRYTGPHMDGVEIDWAGQTYVCPHDKWVSLPLDAVHGTPHELDGDQIVVHGTSGLLKQGLDDEGNGTPQWETRSKKQKPAPDTDAHAHAPADEG